MRMGLFKHKVAYKLTSRTETFNGKRIGLVHSSLLKEFVPNEVPAIDNNNETDAVRFAVFNAFVLWQTYGALAERVRDYVSLGQ